MRFLKEGTEGFLFTDHQPLIPFSGIQFFRTSSRLIVYNGWLDFDTPI